MDYTQITVAIITAIPTLAVGVSSAWMNSQRLKDKKQMIAIAEKNASKAAIQNMITQDIIRTEILGKLPENKDNIEAEYENYHKNGGNGTITRQVDEYNNWYKNTELRFRCREVIDKDTGEKIKICRVEKNDD
jgi:hypothetical protein